MGEMKGQVILAIRENNAKDIASRMMFGMPVNELDEMASSALNELGNMIMGNTATIFPHLELSSILRRRLLYMAMTYS